MTLREKFWNVNQESFTDRMIANEKIADEYASAFSSWTWAKILITINDVDLFEYRFNVYSEKELLKMYKKEKGL
jgi:hypothetical protein